MLHFQEWGEGDPLVALHALALESSAFEGVAASLATQGVRTLAVDLPGFGQTSLDEDAALTPAFMARPVVELARSLERPPWLVGFSMGGRVALEAALIDPAAFRGVVAVVPFLPWRRWRPAMESMRSFDPRWAERLPLERVWPALKCFAERIEQTPRFEHDWLARAAVRFVYYSSCPATRTAFMSAVREMCLDPAFGPTSLWERMDDLQIPATFVWAGRDGLIPRGHWDLVSRFAPAALQLEVPCAGHFASGVHYRCMQEAIVMAVNRMRGAGPGRPEPRELEQAPCLSASETAKENPGERVQTSA